MKWSGQCISGHAKKDCIGFEVPFQKLEAEKTHFSEV